MVWYSHLFKNFPQFVVIHTIKGFQFSCSVVFDSVTLWKAARQASLSITNSRSLLKLMSIVSVMPSNHLILCHPFTSCLQSFLAGSFPTGQFFASGGQSIRSFSFSISPSNEYSGLFPLGWIGWISLQSKGLSIVFSNTTVQKHQFFGTQLSYGPPLTSIYDKHE